MQMLKLKFKQMYKFAADCMKYYKTLFILDIFTHMQQEYIFFFFSIILLT